MFPTHCFSRSSPFEGNTKEFPWKALNKFQTSVPAHNKWQGRTTRHVIHYTSFIMQSLGPLRPELDRLPYVSNPQRSNHRANPPFLKGALMQANREKIPQFNLGCYKCMKRPQCRLIGRRSLSSILLYEEQL